MAKYCENCGKELTQGAAFCAECGAPAGGERRVGGGQPVKGGGAAPAAGRPEKRKTEAGAAGAGGAGSFAARLKEAVLDYFRHPLKLLPTAVLTLIWIVFSLLGTLGRSSPAIRVLNTLSYSNGGMYGGIVGAVGGIFGKAFFAAIVTSLINALTEKKTASSRRGSAGAGVKGAALSGLKAVAPYLIGSGAGLVLYWFFNITATPKNLMVAVAGAAAAAIAVIRGRGFLFSLVSGVTGLLSGGRAPSLGGIKRTLTGFAAGFAVAVPATLLRRPWILIAAGAALLAAGIVLSLIGKNAAKRAASGAAVLLLVGGLLFSFGRPALAAGFDPELAGNYTGTIRMVSGAVTEEGYANYTRGGEKYVSFVNQYMGGRPSETLSREEFDKQLKALIGDSEIAAVNGELRIAAENDGTCTVSFSLAAENCKWKAGEDVYRLGSEPIEMILKGSYADGKIEISVGAGDLLEAQGTIEFARENGRITASSSDLAVAVANQGVSCYVGGILIDVEKKETKPGPNGEAAGITLDDIVGYYRYTGMNYATEQIEDFYYKIEKLSGSTFRFSSLVPVEELPEVDWESIYGDDENVTIIKTDNHADLSRHHFDPAAASSRTDENIMGVKVTEHYPELGISIDTYNSETRSYNDMVFSWGEDGRIHAVYENHIDLGAGYSTLDHMEMVKVDYLPGEEPPEESAPPTGAETEELPAEPETEPAETGPLPAEPTEPENDPGPELPPDPEDPDRADLPDSEAGVISEAAATAIIGGGVGTLLGGLAGAIGGGGPGGPGGGSELPPSWRVNSEGDISFEDPITGETVTYVQTGVDPDTGQPEYHNAKDWGQGYDVNDLKDMYERSSGERDYYRKIDETAQSAQKEQREDNQGLSWEAKDWEREKKENAERERQEDYRNQIAYKRGVYDGDTKEFKKKVLTERGQIYQEQARHEARAEYMNAGFQTAQTVQKTVDATMNVAEKVAEKTGNPAIIAKAKIIKKSYLAARNAASNLGEWTAGNKNLTQAVTDTAISTGGDLIKDSANGFGQKLLYNTTMEGGKTVFQGWVDGKSAEEIRDETLKKMEKGFNDTVNEGVNSAVFGDGVFSQVLTEIDNWEANEE